MIAALASRVVQIGQATLILGDCVPILPHLTGIGAVLADPPFGKRYTSRHNTGGGRSRPEWARKDGGFQPINGDQKPFDPTPILALNVPTILWGANYFNDLLPRARRWLVWDKLAGKTPARSTSDVELAWCSVAGVDRQFTHLWRGIIRAGEENVTNGPKQHPHQKPVALMTWCLGFLPPPGAVLDPYMGSGSTGVACLRKGRAFVGIENDETYFDRAVGRITTEVRKLAA